MSKIIFPELTQKEVDEAIDRAGKNYYLNQVRKDIEINYMHILDPWRWNCTDYILGR